MVTSVGCSGTAPSTTVSSSTPTPSGGKPNGLMEKDFDYYFPQDVDAQLQDCWQTISNGAMGAPSEAEQAQIGACMQTGIPGATIQYTGLTAGDKYSMVAMLGITAISPIPGDEVVTLAYILYQGAKYAIVALTAAGAAYVTSETIVYMAGRHSSPQHGMTHTTARTYANIVRTNLTSTGGPKPDIKCAIVLMATGAIRYVAMVPTMPFSGRGIVAWWEGSSWGGAYATKVSRFPNQNVDNGVKIIETVACSKLPPPPGLLAP